MASFAGCQGLIRERQGPSFFFLKCIYFCIFQLAGYDFLKAQKFCYGLKSQTLLGAWDWPMHTVVYAMDGQWGPDV